jgi:uncharacterized protein YukE
MPTVKAVRQKDDETTKNAAKTSKKPAPKAAKKVTMDDVWAGFDRFQKEMDRFQKGMDEIREAHAEAVKSLRETHAETEKTLNRAISSTEKNLNKAIGGLSNTMGALVERFMTVGLPQKFKPFGFAFDRVTTVKWADGENNLYAEIDGLLENGDQAMAVEVKTTLRNEDVDDHLDRMEKVRKYADLHGDRREFLSAMAATIVSKSAKEYALKKGLFVIEPSGEDVKVTRPVAEKV